MLVFFPWFHLPLEQLHIIFPGLPNISAIKEPSHFTFSCSIFGIHDPISLRHLFQIRVGLSKLREHKKCHNFADTPSDLCLCKSGIENTDHFLLQCTFYNSLRAKLRTNVLSILSRNELNFDLSSNLLLYGHESLSDEDNRDILLSTLVFILESNRFDWSSLHCSTSPPFPFLFLVLIS